MIGTAVNAPAGYAVERERGAIVVALPSIMADVLSLLRAHGTLFDSAVAQPDPQVFAGRGAAYRLAMPAGDWIVRHYRRGGAVARVLRDEYLRAGEPRPFRELHASIAARARGVDTPEVVAAVAYLSGPLYRADIATRFVSDSQNLAVVLFGDPAVRPRTRTRTPARTRSYDSVRNAAWHAAGHLLRKVFAAGVEHPDLNLSNILIAGTPDAPRALLLDLDRAVVHEREVSGVAKSAMLERLHRSRRKLELVAGVRSSAEELAALEAGLGGA